MSRLKPFKPQSRTYIYCRDPIHERPRHHLCRTCKGKQFKRVK